jgi:CRISPR-associated endoribonuclease Cas6
MSKGVSTLRIKVELESNKTYLKFVYKYQMQGVIYDLLSDKFNELHDKGIYYNKKNFKPFNFSDIFTKKYEIKEDGLILSNESWFYFSSPFKDITDEFANKLIEKGEIRIGNNLFNIKSIKIILYNLESKNLFKCLSPITVYNTAKINNKIKTIYYKPNDREFKELVENNIKNKSRILDISIDRLEFLPEKFSIKNEKIINYKNTIIKGWTGIYRINANEEIKKMIMDWGIGTKNSQGFGMMEVI